MVGPDFHSPAPPATHKYTYQKLPITTSSSAVHGGNKQYFVNGEDIPGQWWTLFHSQVINDLVNTGLANSPNLAAAESALKESEENYNAQWGTTFFPAITAQFVPQRQRFSGSTLGVANAPGNVFNLFNVQANISYNFDIFGR